MVQMKRGSAGIPVFPGVRSGADAIGQGRGDAVGTLNSLRQRQSPPLFLAVSLALLCAGGVAGGFSVHFHQDVYTILPFETVTAHVLFDYDGTTPGDQPPPLGLFSMGIEIFFPAALAQVPDQDAIVIPDPLNGDGIGGPAPKRVGPGHAGASGAIDLFAAEGYMAPLLASFIIHPLDLGSFALDLDFFFTDTRANFVDFGGSLLDPQVSFGSATVHVIPEPGALGMIAVGIAGLAVRRRA